MVKKKSAKNVNNDDESSSDCNEKTQLPVVINNNKLNENGGAAPTVSSKCSHIETGIQLIKLRKALKENGIRETCNECLRKPTPKATVDEDDDLPSEYDTTLWLCLRCGSQLCGRAKNEHALSHSKVSRSEPAHNVTINTTTYDVWCYGCDDSINPGGQRKLEECIEMIKKEQDKTDQRKKDLSAGRIGDIGKTLAPLVSLYQATTPVSPTVAINNEKNLGQQPASVGVTPSVSSSSSAINLLPRAKGLSNLGNTCFFNAVLQCLSQCPYLLDVLKQSAEQGEKFQLPGGLLKLSDDEEINLPMIDGVLQPWGNVTSSLAETLEELQSCKNGGGVFRPSKLLQHLTHKWPQFAGGDQHDSHELLRHLLESVRSEDVRRYQVVILNTLGFPTKIDPQKVDDKTKKKIKFYGDQAQDRILGPEPVFRGFLVSTLTCMDCHHTSSRHESFLDISLPVFVEKSQPPMRRKNSPDVEQQTAMAFAAEQYPDTNLSPKKAVVNKKLERKMKKKQKAEALQQLRQKNQQDFFGTPSATPLNDPICAGDGVEAAVANGSNSSSSAGSGEQSDADVEDNLNDESGKNNSEDLDENGNPKKGDPPPAPLLFEDAESELLAKNHVVEMALSAEGKDNLMKRIDSLSLADTKQAAKAKKMDWSATLGQRYHCKDGECSIESCFNNFTATELMTGSNKVGCEACTERINGKNGKTINTNATKQFLISSPPGVLILHLKRFQVGPKHIFRKINKHVEFPLILDIAPFCGMKVKNLPNINANQKKLLYELYGIVEHSGGMRGGHYVAYIKVRGKFDRDDPKWKFLPKGSKAECDQIDEHKAQIERMLSKEQQRNHTANPDDSDDLSTTSSSDDLEGAVGGSDDEVVVTKSPGKWYYVSDSFVKEIAEADVLKAEAYLLFYERVY